MTIDEIIARLDALTGEDAERDHAGADELLLLALTESGNAAVVDAYDRLAERVHFWAYEGLRLTLRQTGEQPLGLPRPDGSDRRP